MREATDLDEGAMPASVIRVKEKIRLMSAAEKKEHFAGKSKAELAQMERRHGYGVGSGVYTQHVTESIDEGMTRQDRERAANEAERRAAAIANNPRIAAEVERRKKAAEAARAARAASMKEEVIDEKLTVGGGAPVKSASGVVSNTPPKKKPTSVEPTKSFVNSHEPRKSAQVSSAMGRLRSRMKPVAEGRSDVVLKTNASSMDANDVHIQKLKDHGIFAQQGAGASHHIIVSTHHSDKAKEILSGHLKEAKMVASADYKLSASGRKVHKLKKVADDKYEKEDDLDSEEEKKNVKEGAVPAHMQGKQKPYVSSDGKGGYEVLGNKGQVKATFSRAEHGSLARGKAQAHVKANYDEYMKEETELEEAMSPQQDMDFRKMMAGAMSKDAYNARWKKPMKSDSKVIYGKNVKEELEEAVDKQEGRFMQLARLGLVDKSDVSKLRTAMEQLKSDKQLSTQQRTLMLAVMMDLVDLVTGDDAVFQRVKMDVQKEETEPPFDKPYTTSKGPVTDKSGAVHTTMSRVRHLAQLALKKNQEKKANKDSNK